MITVTPSFSCRQEFNGSTITIFLYITYATSISITLKEGFAIGENGQLSESFSFIVVYSKQPVRPSLSCSQSTLRRSQVSFYFTMTVDMPNLEDYFIVENGVASLFYFNGISGHLVVSPKKAANITVTLLRSKN